MKSRGRPKGHRLSEETKAKISKSKTGYKHSEATKKKIADSVSIYQRSIGMIRKFPGVKKKASANCKLKVAMGKVWCTVCKDFHEVDKTNTCWKHRLIKIPMRHILYIACYCTECNNGKVLIDSEV